MGRPPQKATTAALETVRDDANIKRFKAADKILEAIVKDLEGMKDRRTLHALDDVRADLHGAMKSYLRGQPPRYTDALTRALETVDAHEE